MPKRVAILSGRSEKSKIAFIASCILRRKLNLLTPANRSRCDTVICVRFMPTVMKSPSMKRFASPYLRNSSANRRLQIRITANGRGKSRPVNRSSTNQKTLDISTFRKLSRFSFRTPKMRSYPSPSRILLTKLMISSGGSCRSGSM